MIEIKVAIDEDNYVTNYCNRLGSEGITLPAKFADEETFKLFMENFGNPEFTFKYNKKTKIIKVEKKETKEKVI